MIQQFVSIHRVEASRPSSRSPDPQHRKARRRSVISVDQDSREHDRRASLCGSYIRPRFERAVWSFESGSGPYSQDKRSLSRYGAVSCKPASPFFGTVMTIKEMLQLVLSIVVRCASSNQLCKTWQGMEMSQSLLHAWRCCLMVAQVARGFHFA